MGMRNHEWVPLPIVERLSKCKKSLVKHLIETLQKYKLISHISKPYEGYKLQFTGYDYLALSVFRKLGVIKTIEMKVGVGKESDIYLCRNTEGKILILKLARLGRTSFKTVKNNREYLSGQTHFNWLYISRLSSMREFKYMQVLFEVR